MEINLRSFFTEDLQNSRWPAVIGNVVSRPCQYAFGGLKVEVIDSNSLVEVQTAWNDLCNGHIARGLLKTAAIVTLIWFSVPLTLCFKGLSYLLTSEPPKKDESKEIKVSRDVSPARSNGPLHDFLEEFAADLKVPKEITIIPTKWKNIRIFKS